jgi:hypothetical protein
MIEVVKAFDEYLGKKGCTFQATIIGGSALLLMGVIERATQDVDCLSPKVPKNIKEISVEFARWYSSQHKTPLQPDWLNNGPESLLRDLPGHWQEHIQPIYQGKHLTFYTLGREDLLLAKLFAYCDRQQDLQDCIALKPSLEELKKAYTWLVKRDVNPQWPDHVMQSLKILAEKLGYEFKT